MPLVFLFLIQQAFGPPVPPALRPVPLRLIRPACPSVAVSGDITVCARPGPDQRLEPLPDRRTVARNPSVIRLPGGGSAAIGAAQSIVGGFTAPAAKATLRIPFGRGKRD